MPETPEDPRPTSGSPPRISIVIPVRDDEKQLRLCLEAINRQTPCTDGCEIIVVDDGSRDGSAQVAHTGGARIIRQERKGAAAARNRGVREARGDVVLFTDADCVPDAYWLERLSRPLLYAGVQGTVGRCESRQQQWLPRMIQVELDERYSRMKHYDYVDFLNTGNCGFSKLLLGDHPFDESFRWLEDVELSFRLARNGNRMVFVPDARVEHLHPESLLIYLKRKFHYANYVPTIYGRYPGKTFSDTRTPVNRRLQILLLGAAAVIAPGAFFYRQLGLVSVACVAGSIGFSLPLIIRAFRTSIILGMLAPWFTLMSNLAFVAGTLWGLLQGLRRGSDGR